jgi:hypothetical protein
VNIVQALEDPELFGALPVFQDLTTWSRWLVFLKAVYGLPLAPDEVPIFCAHTGRAAYTPPPGGWKEVAVICGRQAGKSRIAAVIGAYEALAAAKEPDETDIWALLISQDAKAATRVLFSYCRAIFAASRRLEASLVDESLDAQTNEVLRLKNGVSIGVYPCRPPAVRGLRARVVVLDELAYFRSGENLPLDVEMLRAVRPTLAMTGGRLIILSSPGGRVGALWQLYRKHFGQETTTLLTWQAAAPDLNPTLPADYIASMEAEDPEAAVSEVGGQFRAGVAAAFDPDAVAKCVAPGLRMRPMLRGYQYIAFVDMSDGRNDSAALAIAHHEPPRRELPGRAVLDLLDEVRPPFDPGIVVRHFAQRAAEYGLRRIYADRWAWSLVASVFRDCGVTLHVAVGPAPFLPGREPDRDHPHVRMLATSELYLLLVQMVNSGEVELLDHARLLAQLNGLERRLGRGGHTTISHISGQHDDVAAAVAGACAMVWSGRRRRGRGRVELAGELIIETMPAHPGSPRAVF